MPGEGNDPMLLARLGQLQSQLDRLEEDMDRIGDRFNMIDAHFDKVGTGIGNNETRIAVLESWRAGVERRQETDTSSREWLIGTVIAAVALVVAVISLVVHL